MFTLDLSHIQPKRKDLADLEFKNRDIDNLDHVILIKDRIRSLELRLQLENLYIPQWLYKKINFSKAERKIASVKEEEPKKQTLPPKKASLALSTQFAQDFQESTQPRESIAIPGRIRWSGISKLISYRRSSAIPVARVMPPAALSFLLHYRVTNCISIHATTFLSKSPGLHFRIISSDKANRMPT